MTVVKVCGIREAAQGQVALETGANLLGFILYPPSHRYVTPEKARDLVTALRETFGRDWKAVGVFVNEPLEFVNRTAELADLDMVQLAGQEDSAFCRSVSRPVIKVVRVDDDGQPVASTNPADWNAERILLDTLRKGSFGGTGEAYCWAGVKPHAGRALIAGGLSPANVRTALLEAAPWGLDVSSGVERNQQKDPELIRAFIEEVKRHDGAR